METGTVLLEREAQLAALASYAGEARKAQGRLVLIAGEAGVGKSALVEQVQRDLPDANWFWGACDGLFTPRPLGPLFDIAAKLGGELLLLCRADAPREALFGALLRQVSEPDALHVVVMEDIHWADEARLGPGRGAGPRRPAGRQRPHGAGRGRADRHPGRVPAAGVGYRLPAVRGR